MSYTSHVPSVPTQSFTPQPSSKVCFLAIVFAFGLGCGFVSWSKAGPVERARGVCLAPEVHITAESPISLLALPVHSGQTVHEGQTLAEIRDETAWNYRNELEKELQESTEQVAERTRQYESELNLRMAQLDDVIQRLKTQDETELGTPEILGLSAATVGITSQPSSKLQELERERLELPAQIRKELELDQLIAKQQECQIAFAEWERLAEAKPWTAPTGGVVAGVHVNPEATLPANALFMTIQDTDHPKVRVELKAAKAARLEIGQRVSVRFSPKEERIGILESIDTGRHLAGTAAFRDDPRYRTLTIAPAERWPSVRQESGVEIRWNHVISP
ncbi:HlyD family efflux transporter periplasmic adaptor subunit [Thalassoroseus pseudoceratinae]|uniref:HlyD family efflux transporter periplasmic adaptor subunit n=1 Tax=Thalassoroseus pseudoceratinae TaxID=2713176 RepID=UPI0014243D09|nr:HlyD family secretion protein [Thalassoroseus pseudoceratinae]